MNSIKTKQSIQTIKTKNSKENLTHFIKQQTIHSKENNKEDSSSKANASARAIDNISNTAKTTAYESAFRAKKYVNQKLEQHRTKKQIERTTAIMDSSMPKVTYMSKAKRYVQKKINASSIKEAADRIITRPAIQTSAKFISASFNVVKKTIGGINALLSFGTGVILIVIMTLFIGTFSVLAQDGGSNSMIIPLSPEVIAYEETITRYAEENGVEDYIPILQAIMMQESRGLGNDPMQCSESSFNTKYPRIPNGIPDPVYSIECGVKTFADCLNRANVKDKSDTERLYLAIQGYNYGNGYIEWAISNFGGYSKYNAQLFSDDMKTKLNASTYGDPEYVNHVMQYVPVTFRGGINPNFNNMEAWITKNPYARAGLYGQCTWFAWGRFYELYGYDPGFTGNGWDCVDQLVAAHPDLFERSLSPKPGSIFSGIGVNHVGIVVAVDGDYVTIQEGNLDGKTNTFQDAKTDWHTVTYTLNQLKSYYRGVVFANPSKLIS